MNEMNKTLIKFLSVFLVLLSLVYGCNKVDKFDDYTLTELDAEFAVPLFTTGFTLADLVENFDDSTNVSYDADGLLTFRYQGESVARSSEDIFKVLDTINGVPIPFFNTINSLPFEPPNGVFIDRAIIKSGIIATWGFSVEHEEDVTCTLVFPSLIKDGQPLQSSISLDYTGTTPMVGFKGGDGIDLSDYEIEVEDDSVTVEFHIFREQSGIMDTMTAGFIQFFDVRASYVEGYLGNELYEFDRDTILIDAFDDWDQGEVSFVNPEIKIDIENSFGFPVRSFTNVLDIFTKDGEVISLESEFTEVGGPGIDFDYPLLDEVGEVKFTEFSFDKTNSNIDVVVSSGPRAVDYDFEAYPNPDNDTTIRGFLTDSSSFLAQVEVILPVYGTLADFGVFDTLKVETFDFDIDLGEFGEADYAEFKLVTVNEMPLDIDLQLYFADENGQILDSLFEKSELIILAAPVDENGIVTQSIRKETFSRMDNERFEKLNQTRNLLLKSNFSTINNGTTDVQLRGSQKVDIGMGLKFGVSK